jgi:hypothetical protein
LESSGVALLRVASGLESLMVGGKNSGTLLDSNVAQISAALYYEAQVIAKISSSKKFKKVFTDTIFNQIDEDFGDYIDALARTKPKSLHHVYEWKKSGVKNSRLFKLNKIAGTGISFKVNYIFLPSRKFVPDSPLKRRHVFINKAEIIEKGDPLTIRPRHSQRLVFKIDDTLIFMPKGKSVYVKNPGGSAARNQFSLAYNRFFRGNLVNESIRKSGFQKIFNANVAKAMSLPASIKKVQYSFSPNIVRGMADHEVQKAFGGALI